jgi:hypothetical protein
MWKPLAEPTQQRTLKRRVGYGDYYMDAEEIQVETEQMEVDKHVDKRQNID